MKKKLGITEGEWRLSVFESYGRQTIDLGNNERALDIWYYGGEKMTKKEARVNAKLIADAGTTANKCGLLPSELLKQRGELLAELKHVTEAMEVINVLPTGKEIIKNSKSLIQSIEQ